MSQLVASKRPTIYIYTYIHTYIYIYTYIYVYIYIYIFIYIQLVASERAVAQDQSVSSGMGGMSSSGASSDDEGEEDGSSLDQPPPLVASSLRQGMTRHASVIQAKVEAGPNLQVLNQKAVLVMTRVQNKLHGRDFEEDKVLNVDEQVSRLIAQATSRHNLCQCYIGWCPFW
jgi:FKBP12-rapamycin complex-associated protein